MSRKYDIVLLGATGYTGQLTAEYLAQHASLNIAIAGRSLKRLNALKKRLQRIGSRHEIGLIKADVQDQASLEFMAGQANVVITTVGPYIHYGEPVVRACLQAQSHYLDLSGEPEYVDHIFRKYHTEAQSVGIQIVNCCGFDSVPHDLGVRFALRTLSTKVAGEMEGEYVRVRAYVSGQGDYSGGTWHSLIHAMSHYDRYLKQQKYWRKKSTLKDTNRVFKKETPLAHYHKGSVSWALPFPTVDTDIIMRSARSLAYYGARFEFGHYVLFKHLPSAIRTGLKVGGIFSAAQFKLTRNLLLSSKKQGDGPSVSQREKGWFNVRVEAHSSQEKVCVDVSGGDPAYGETSKMLAEAGIFVAQNTCSLAGVLTPSEALGDEFIEQLNKAGINFTVVDVDA